MTVVRSSDMSLEQVEADIRLCEEFLSRDRFGEDGQAQAPASSDRSVSARQEGVGMYESTVVTTHTSSTTTHAHASSKAGAGSVMNSSSRDEGDGQRSAGPTGRRMTEDRRQEILRRLEAERQQRRSEAFGSATPSPGSAAEAQRRADRVRQLLMERQKGGAGGGPADGGGAAVSRGGGGGGDQWDSSRGGGALISPPSTAAPSEVGRASPHSSAITGRVSAMSMVEMDVVGEYGERGAGGFRGGGSGGGVWGAQPAAAPGEHTGDDAGASERHPIMDPHRVVQPQRQRYSTPAGTGVGPGGRPGRTPASAMGGDGGGSQRRPMSAPRERPPPKTTRVQEFNLTGSKGKGKSRVVQQMEQEMKKHLTFRPTINRRPHSASANRVENVGAAERIQQLATPRTYDKYVERRRAREEEDLSECTFRPAVGRPPETRPMANVPPERRLTADWEHRYAVRERAKVELERQQLRECTFRPDIGTANRFVDPATYRPIHERVGELQRRKSELLTRARMEAEAANPDLTFAPTVNPTSQRLAEERESAHVPVVDRLATPAGAAATGGSGGGGGGYAAYPGGVSASSSQRRRGHPDPAEECSFQPSITESSRRLAEERPGRQLDFLARQEEEMRRREQHRQALVQRELDSDECTFAPDTGNAGRVLAQSRRHMRVAETPEERVTRLAYKEQEERDMARARLQNSYYGQYTFKPKINATSERISRPATVDEMVRNDRNSAVRERVQREAEEEFRRECTFKPAINQRSGQSEARYPASRLRAGDAMRDPDGLMQRIEEYQREKEVRIQRERDEREYEDLKQCTFTPEVNPKIAPQANGPVVVRGLGRHMELQEMAKRAKEEQRARESRLFWERPQGSAGQYTIPAPFNLSHSDGHSEAVRARVQAEVEAERAVECTFRPITNEAANRALLSRILDADPVPY